MKSSKSEREILRKLKENKYFLKQRFGIKDIAIFGSFINNTQTESSDIDINISFTKKVYYIRQLYRD